MSDDEGHTETLKFLVVGDSAVGKSALLMRYTDDIFSETYISTLGIDFKTRTVEVGGEKVKLQIWDSAGQERFRTITKSFFRNASGIVLAYSVTDQASFRNVNTWVKSIKESVPDDSIVIVIVGNKIDLEEQRTVTTKEGEDIAASFGVSFFETSAKTGENVDTVFQNLAESVYKPKKGRGKSGGGSGAAANNNNGNKVEPAGNVELGNSNAGGSADKKGCC